MKKIEVSSYGNDFLYGCSSLKKIVFHEDIKNVSGFKNNMLHGSDVEHVVFLGISSIDTISNNIIGTKCFGLNKNCLIQINNAIYKYDALAQTLTLFNSNIFEYGQQTVTDDQIAEVEHIQEGKRAKFQVNVLYQFSKNLAELFMPYSKTGTLTQQIAMPIMIFYIDSKTSVKSIEFIDDILKNKEFQAEIKSVANTPTCMYMVYDRSNPGSVDDWNFFKTEIKDKIQIQSFPCIILYWKGQFKVMSFNGMAV